jgi:hypothetical protein
LGAKLRFFSQPTMIIFDIFKTNFFFS